MRKAFFLSFIFCLQLSAVGQGNIDVLHYQFNIELNDANDTVRGVAIINFKTNTNAIAIDLASLDSKGKGMIVTGVESNGQKKLTIAHKDNQLLIGNKEFSENEISTLTIGYKGVPADGLIISKTKYGQRSFFADNWPDRGHNWIPCHDDPADKATVEFIVTAPEHYQVVANGVQIEESSLGKGRKLTHWREDIPISPKVMVIGVADFAVHLAGVVNGNIPVYSWVYPENKDKGFYEYGMAKEILPYFINNIGPYGYKKLANVQSKTRFGGLENANTIFYSENSVTGTRKSEGLIAHEIAHQWFGNMATEKTFGHLWLSEGFATYFTVLYFENKYGKDTALRMLREDREQVIAYSKESNKPVVDTGEKKYMNLLNVNSYQKGSWILHMLRRQLGDKVFWESIRKYYADYAGHVADTRDLQKVFENVSGKDLKQFFDQWLYTPGQPNLDIIWKYDESEKNVYVEVKQQQKNVFYFPLQLKISGKKEKIFVDKATASFKIKVDQQPAAVIVDPETELLMSNSIRQAN